MRKIKFDKIFIHKFSSEIVQFGLCENLLNLWKKFKYYPRGFKVRDVISVPYMVYK